MRKKRAKRLLLVLSVLGCALAATASPAVAVTVHPSGPYPGTATRPQTWLFDGSDPFDYAYYVQPNARTVYESPRYPGSWQWVCVQHRMWNYTPASYSGGIVYPAKWSIDSRTPWECKWISPAASSVNFPFRQFKVDLLPVDLYAQDTQVTWALQNGTSLGKKIYDYNRQTDYSVRDGLWLTWGTAQNGDVYFSGVCC